MYSPSRLDSILKSRNIILLTKVHIVKAMLFPVVMYGWESWTVKEAECWRIDAFQLWCWRRLLRVPWAGEEIQPVHPKGDQSWIFTGRTDGEAEVPTLWPPDAKNWLTGKDLMLGNIESRRRRGRQRIRWLDGIIDLMDMSWASSRSWWWTGKPGELQSMGSQSWTQLSDWTELHQYTFDCIKSY